MAGRFSVETVFKAVDRVTRPVSRMQQSVGKFTRSATRGLRRVNRAIDRTAAGVKSIGVAAIKYGVVGIGAVTASVGLLVREFSKIENAQAAFTPLLGGAERAKEMVEALNKTAASTPFQFEMLARAANQLLPTMNGNIEQTIRTMRMLGDAAGGNAQKLDSITHGFTKAMLKGKVDMESLNMIAEAGVPIFTELAESMGTKVGPAFFKMISAGRVTTAQLTTAFEKMTQEGGVFFNGMQIASKTTTGMFSTLKDNISLTAAELGSVLAPTIKDLILRATELARRVRQWVGANRELINAKFLEFVDVVRKTFWGLVDAFRWLRKNKDVVTKLAATILALVVALKAFAAVMAIVNIVMWANPVGLLILGIAALITALAAAVIWWDEIKAALISFGASAKKVIMAVLNPIGTLVDAAPLLMKAWEPVKAFFKDLWADVVAGFDAAVAKMTGAIDRIKGTVSSVAKGALNPVQALVDAVPILRADTARGNDTDGSTPPPSSPQVVSPQDRTARLIEDRRTTSSAEVTIRDETQRAEVTSGQLGNNIFLTPSGAF